MKTEECPPPPSPFPGTFHLPPLPTFTPQVQPTGETGVAAHASLSLLKLTRFKKEEEKRWWWCRVTLIKGVTVCVCVCVSVFHCDPKLSC